MRVGPAVAHRARLLGRWAWPVGVGMSGLPRGTMDRFSGVGSVGAGGELLAGIRRPVATCRRWEPLQGMGWRRVRRLRRVVLGVFSGVVWHYGRFGRENQNRECDIEIKIANGKVSLPNLHVDRTVGGNTIAYSWCDAVWSLAMTYESPI